MRKLLLVIAAIAGGGVLARKLAARSNTQVHRINQGNQNATDQRSER